MSVIIFGFLFIDQNTKTLKSQLDDMNHLDMQGITEKLISHYEIAEKRFIHANWMDNYLEDEDLDHVYVQLVYAKESDLRQKQYQSGEIFDMYDSFNNCKGPKKVLWIGDAGMGKTTACRKIAVDWSQNTAEFRKCFPGVELVVLLKCRDFDSDLQNSISELLLSGPVNKEEKEKLLTYLKNNASKVLFVIDGIDELKHVGKELDDLLQGRKFEGSHMIITSRREGLKGCRKYFQSSTFEIIGFNSFGVKQFVTKFYSQDELLAMTLLNKIEHDQILSELSRNPLCLLILCVVWEDMEEDLPGRRYDLYSCFLNSVIVRMQKKYPDAYGNIDCHLNIINVLGKLAYETLATNKTSFSDSDLQRVKSPVLVKDMVKCTGLVKIDKSCKKKAMWYEFFHKSFQEFLACLYVIQQLQDVAKEDSQNISDEFQWLLQILPGYMSGQTIPRYGFCKWAFPVVVSFLCGSPETLVFETLFRDTFHKIVKLESNGWHSWSYLLCPCLKELSPDNMKKASAVLAKILPSTIHMESLADMNLQNRLTFIKRSLQYWSVNASNGHLLMASDLTDENEMKAFEEILKNKSLLTQTLEVTADCLGGLVMFQNLAKTFWISNLERLNLKITRKRYITIKYDYMLPSKL